MNKSVRAALALAATCGAIYGAVIVNATAQSTPKVPASERVPLVKTARKPQQLKSPAVKRHMDTLPPLTKFELKNIPPKAIPMNFNGGEVYWIPLDEKTPIKTKNTANPRTLKSS